LCSHDTFDGPEIQSRRCWFHTPARTANRGGGAYYLTWCGAERGAAFFREEDCGVCFVARLRCAGEESKLWRGGAWRARTKPFRCVSFDFP